MTMPRHHARQLLRPLAAAALPLSFTTPEYRTDIVPEPGDFTVGVLFRLDGFGDPQPHTEWKNGMVFSCESGYYDGFRLLLDDENRFRPVFEIGRAEGAVQLKTEDATATNAWHHAAVSWQCADTATGLGTMRLFLDGRQVAESPPDRPAPILRGAPLRVGYVDYGVGALAMEARHLLYEPRPLSAAEVRAAATAALDALPSELAADSSVAHLRQSLDTAAFAETVQGRDDDSFRARWAAQGVFSGEEVHHVLPSLHGGDGAAALEAALEEAAKAAERSGPGVRQVVEFSEEGLSFRRTVEIAGPRFANITLRGSGWREFHPNAGIWGTVYLHGTDFRPVEDPVALRRLPTDEARAKVVCMAVPGLPAPRAYGNGFPERFGLLPVLDNEYGTGGWPMPCATWPNDGYERGSFADGVARIASERAKRWAGAPAALAHGYWRYDWADAAVPVRIEDDGALRPLAEPGYGFGETPRLRVMNLLEELDSPGEWALENGVFYFWPDTAPANLPLERVHVAFPALAEPFLRLRDCPGLRIEGIHFGQCAGDALVAENCRDLVLDGLEFERIGGTAMVLAGADGARVEHCHVTFAGHGGLYLVAGDRDALRGGDAIVRQCVFSAISLLAKTYEPAIRLEGCGIRVDGCLFSQTASSAMRVEGNDHVVENCRFFETVLESDDQGAIDMWGDPTYRGCVFRGNVFEFVGGDKGVSSAGRAAIRLDDFICGMTICGNTFRNASQGNMGAVQIHGGHHNRVFGNVFEDCAIGVSFGGWDRDRWLKALDGAEIAAKLRGRADNPAWLQRYPELARLREDRNVNEVHDNVFLDCPRPFHGKGAAVQDWANAVLPAKNQH